MSVEALFAELSQLTKLDRAKWERILSAPPNIQKLELQNYADQDWAAPSTSTGARVVAILLEIGTIAGVVGGIASGVGAVAGAVTAVAALKSL